MNGLLSVEDHVVRKLYRAAKAVGAVLLECDLKLGYEADAAREIWVLALAQVDAVSSGRQGLSFRIDDTDLDGYVGPGAKEGARTIDLLEQEYDRPCARDRQSLSQDDILIHANQRDCAPGVLGACFSYAKPLKSDCHLIAPSSVSS